MPAIDTETLPTDHERELLRTSLRNFLLDAWPPGATQNPDGQSLLRVWSGLAELGLSTLGSDASLGGAREMCVAAQELGRASAPIPLGAAALWNLAWQQTQPAEWQAFAEQLHAGKVRLTQAWGECDAGACSEDLQLEAGLLSGTLRGVEAADQASHVMLATPDGWYLLDAHDSRVRQQTSTAMGAPGWWQLELDQVPVRLLAADMEQVRDARLLDGLLLHARAWGAAQRSFELVVEYAKERRQFGKPIGSFQAIQHKLANGLIALEGSRLSLWSAAQSHDFGDANWRYFAQAAIAYSGDALRQVVLECQHTFGAIGYAKEHEAPAHFRRVSLDTLAHGGVSVARAALAASLLDQPLQALPRYDLGPAGNAYREEVRAWLQAHWSGERKAAYDARPFHDREYDASFAHDLGATGWLGLNWSTRFGGQQRSAREQLAFFEEMERAEAPPRFGASVQAQALILHGTAEQQQRYLPEILRGEAMHGMGYSEPESGSDLASLRTSAVLQGNQWVINGQKIWTTTWWGKYMFLAARTDPAAQPAHAGISMFIVPMDAPGITVRPAETMYDGSFANIFYDDVRIPEDHLIGPLNGGWKVLTDALATERGMVGGGIVLKVVHGFERLCQIIHGCPQLRDDPLVRDRIGAIAADIEVGRQLMIHCAELAEQGATPAHVGAMSKVFCGELMERYAQAALDILGPQAALSQGAPAAIDAGRFEQQLRHSLMWVISIGTNEIQRSLIAQRGLGLPR